jgi:hypothetical protein
MAQQSVARSVVASCLACELPPLFSLPLSSCRAAQASFGLARTRAAAAAAATAPPGAVLAPPPKRNVLVLDIDETLVFSYKALPSPTDPRIVHYAMLLRPHVETFLLEVEQLFDLVFWTAGTASYCAAVMAALQTAMGRAPSKCYAAQAILDQTAKGAAQDSIGVAGAQRQLLKDGLLSNQDAFPPWPSLSRSQTLQELDYMKYLPLLGFDAASVVMVDDHERSFPLTPRNGVKVARFAPASAVEAALLRRKRGAGAAAGGCALLDELPVPFDDALLQLLPVLRWVAAAADVRRELDHWRPDDYVDCDAPLSTLNPLSRTRRRLLGTFAAARRDAPIAPHRSPNDDPPEAELQQLLAKVSAAAAETVARTNASRRYGPLMSHI